MVNAFRFGFLGVSDVDVGVAFALMAGAVVVLFSTAVIAHESWLGHPRLRRVALVSARAARALDEDMPPLLAAFAAAGVSARRSLTGMTRGSTGAALMWRCCARRGITPSA